MDHDAFISALDAEAARQKSLRSQSFSDTMNWIAPLLPLCGITRVTSVTSLDNLGIPTYCSIRPSGKIMQVSNGKGLTAAAAEVSAAMEAVELFHAETPDMDKLESNCASQLAAHADHAHVMYPDELPQPRELYFSPRFVAEWTCGTDLASGQFVWVPSGAVYLFRRPVTNHIHTNGIASGNTLAEAQLHALYEVIEREAKARLYSDGILKIRDRASVLDTSSIDEPVLCALLGRCWSCDTQVVLLSLPSPIPVHAFWAIFLGQSSIASVSTFNIGSGAHIDPVVAATRALTEAAQSRLAFIHGGRDDVVRKPVHRATNVRTSNAYQYFAKLKPNGTWAEIVSRQTIQASKDPIVTIDRIVSALTDAGLGPVISFDLTKTEIGIPVARVLAPKLRFRSVLH